MNNNLPATSPRRYNSIRPTPSTQTETKIAELPEVKRVSSLRLLSRRESKGFRVNNEDETCKDILMTAMKQDFAYDTSMLTPRIIEVLGEASTLYIDGKEGKAHALIETTILSSESDSKHRQIAPLVAVFFTAEKSRQQNQVQIKKNKDKTTELEKQQLQLKTHIMKVEAEKQDFEESTLQLMKSQLKEARISVDQQILELEKVKKLRSSCVNNGTRQSFIPFDGLGEFIQKELQLKEKLQWIEEDFERKKDTVLHMENEVTDLNSTIQNLRSTIYFVETSISNVRRNQIRLENRKREVTAFVIESAKNISKELAHHDQQSTSVRPLFRKLSIRRWTSSVHSSVLEAR